MYCTMRRLIIVCMFLCGFAAVYAQDVHCLAAKADSLKALYGESDRRYLDAFTDVIQNLYDNKEYEQAYRLRKKHCEIILGKYGADSYEYAEDMFRLGNVATYAVGEQDALGFYLKALDAFEASGSMSSEYYGFCLSRTAACCLSQNNSDAALHYNGKYIGVLKNSGEKGVRMAYAYSVSGDICFDLQNYKEALGYYASSRMELESISDMEEDTFSLYSNILWREGSAHYFLRDYQAAIADRLHLLDVLRARGGNDDMSIMVQAALGEIYLDTGKTDEAIRCYMASLNSLKMQSSSDEELKRNDTYRSILDVLASVYDHIGKEDESEAYTELKIDAMSFVGDTLSQEYLEALASKFSYHCRRARFAEAKNLIEPLDRLAVQYYGYESDEYELFLRNAVDVNIYTFDYDSALAYAKKYNDWANAVKGTGSINHAVAKYALANVYGKKGDKAAAFSELGQCKKILENVSDSQDKVRVSAAYCELAGFLLAEEDPSQAALYISKAIEIKRQVDNTDESAFVNLKTNLGLCYAYAGDYEQALSVFNDVAGAYDSSGKRSVHYLYLMNNIGFCQINLGRLAEGAAILEKTAGETIRNYGTENELYMSILQNQTVYYSRVFDFTKAIEVAEQVAGIAGKIFGQNSIKYGMALQNLGFLYQNVKKYQEAESVLLEALAIIEQSFGGDHIYISHICHNLGSLYIEEHRFDDGDAAFRRSRDILLSNGKGQSFEMFALMMDYGRNLLLSGRSEAAVYLKEAKALCENLELTGHPAYLQLMTFCLGSSLTDDSMGDDLVERTVESLALQYSSNISTFTSAERQAYWSRMNNLKSLLFSQRRTGQDNVALYDYLLISKGMLLGTSVSFESLLSNIPDEEILSDFNRLKSMRSIIRNGLAARNGYVRNLDSLSSAANALERELIFKSKEYGDFSSNLSLDFSDVSAALGKHEVAIEFVNYNDFSTDGEMVYAALLTRYGWKSPAFIRLCKDADLEKIISQQPNKLYSPQEFVANELYRAIWAPVAKYVKKGETVYFAPSGVLYKLALEAVCNEKGLHLGDLYDMRRCSSTRNVVVGDGSSLKYSSAVLYGGIVYDLDDGKIPASDISTSYADYSSGMRFGWAPLDGTKTEIESIGILLDRAGIAFEMYEGEMADEESFESLSGKAIDILHIATHGFFISKEAVRKSDYHMNNTSLGDVYRNAGMAVPDSPYTPLSISSEDEAMLRSGLMLAGGNRAWQGAEVPKGMEDGVLTASEISLMDLRKTDMAVLSACETGLGDISDEGVLGLQRAFKNAGVKTVIMSLWKVDDEATALMMTEFYKSLLAGKSKREAFRTARSAVRDSCDRYKDPFYWAAFIMLD